jgi:hypothetical protein
MAPGLLLFKLFKLFLPALRDHMASLLAVVALLCGLLHRIDRGAA